eukprot:10601311-Karenia_brevis.AAC.1
MAKADVVKDNSIQSPMLTEEEMDDSGSSSQNGEHGHVAASRVDPRIMQRGALSQSSAHEDIGPVST